MRGRTTGTVVMALLALGAGQAEAQWRDRDHRARFERTERATPTFGLALVGADPVGPMGARVDDGFGGQLWGTFPLDGGGHVRIRGDVGFLVYGHERQRLCFSVPIGCRIEMDLTTTNSIAFGGLGPELVLATGAFQPYVNGSVGFSYFATHSSLSGTGEAEDFANTTNYDDVVLAWRAGGGVRVRVANGRRPVWLDLGLERHQNGVAEYLTEGDIVDHSDGSITLFPTIGEANLVALRVGVSIGLGGGDDHDRRHRGRWGRR